MRARFMQILLTLPVMLLAYFLAGLAAARGWIDEERDLREALKAALRGLSMARAYLGPYMRRKVFAVSSLSDPLPAAGLLGELLRR